MISCLLIAGTKILTYNTAIIMKLRIRLTIKMIHQIQSK